MRVKRCSWVAFHALLCGMEIVDVRPLGGEMDLDLVPIAAQVDGFRNVQVIARDDDGREIIVDAEVSEGGYRCAKLTVDCGSKSLSHESLRAIPVGSLLKAAAGNSLFRGAGEGDGLWSDEWHLWPSSVMNEWPNGDVGLVHYFTAMTYSLAAYYGLGPTKAVREAAKVSQTTAGKLIRSARDSGALTTAAPAQSGGRGSELLHEFLRKQRALAVERNNEDGDNA